MYNDDITRWILLINFQIIKFPFRLKLFTLMTRGWLLIYVENLMCGCKLEERETYNFLRFQQYLPCYIIFSTTVTIIKHFIYKMKCLNISIMQTIPITIKQLIPLTTDILVAISLSLTSLLLLQVGVIGGGGVQCVYKDFKIFCDFPSCKQVG